MKIGEKATNSSELNKRGILESVTATSDTDGDTSYTYATIAAVWARVKEPYGRTLMEGYINQVEVPLEVRIRYRDDIDEACVFRMDDIRYEIKNLRDINYRHEYMEFYAVRRKVD
jgi:SPP1 family predicted phage head-tail adaptor